MGRKFPAQLCEELAHAFRIHPRVIDGEIACLNRNGRRNFRSLLSRREWPFFMAFDLLHVDGEDLRPLPLIERKQRLAGVMPPH